MHGVKPEKPEKLWDRSKKRIFDNNLPGLLCGEAM